MEASRGNLRVTVLIPGTSPAAKAGLHRQARDISNASDVANGAQARGVRTGVLEEVVLRRHHEVR